MRQRKKAKSVRYKSEPSQSETMGHMLGISELSEASGPCQPIITSATSSAPTAASNGTDSSAGNSWPYHYSSASPAPALTPSVSTAHAVVSLPGLHRNYIQIQTTINNQPFWNSFPPPHASTVTSQSIVTTSSLRNLGDSSHRSYQFAPYVPQNPYSHQSNHSNVLLVSEVPRLPQSFYASADPSRPAAADNPGQSALRECVLDPQLDSRILSNTTPSEYLTSQTSHTGGFSTGLNDEKMFPSKSRGKHNGDADENGAQQGKWHFEPTSPARKFLNDSVVPKTEFESFPAKKDIVSGSGTVISTPTSDTETAVNTICQGETESSPGSDTEVALEPMSEAEAWKKARAHPDFETFLKMAGVHGNFELTDNGLVHKK